MLIKNTAGDIQLYALVVGAYMRFPSDEIQREKYGSYCVATFAAHASSGGSVDIEPETLLEALQAARDGTYDAAERAVMGGLASGRVLLDVLEHQAAGDADFGLEKAFHTAAMLFQSTRRYDGEKYRAGVDAVLKHWRAFRPVAHLWAAHLVLMGAWEDAGASGDAHAWIADRRALMLQIAHALQLRALEIELPRKGGYLQSRADCWELDGVAPATLEAPALTETAQAWAANYQRRFR